MLARAENAAMSELTRECWSRWQPIQDKLGLAPVVVVVVVMMMMREEEEDDDDD
jgi:hypothetical protein